MASADALLRMEPYGCENPEPVFVARKMTVAQIIPTKNPVHVRLLLQTEAGNSVQGIAFGIGERFVQSGAGITADVLFQATVDEWQGTRSLKWQVKDYAPL